MKCFWDTLRPHFIKRAQNVFLWRFYLLIRARKGNIEMVDWIGKFSLLLKRLKDSWMDLLPLSAMNQQQRESLYQAGMTHLNAERRSSNEARWDPTQQGTRDTWHATQVTAHERLFPFNDNWTSLMFIVASDPREAQRERLTSSLFSPRNECH